MNRLTLVGTTFGLALLVGCVGEPETNGRAEPRETLTLFVAASLTDVIQDIGSVFAETHAVEFVYNSASSGALAQQILASPRADLFLSASERWMDEVEGRGRLLIGSRRTLWSNSLTLIANPSSEFSVDQSTDLCGLPFEFLAIGDPSFVPAGQYAKQWLERLECPGGATIWSQVEPRVSPAPDVRAALAQVEGSREVIGLVYHTDYLARRDAVRFLYRVPASAGPRIRYAVGIMGTTVHSETAQTFLDFLASPTVKALFEKHGFTPVARVHEPSESSRPY